MIKFLLDRRDCVLGVGVALPDGVTDHHDAGPVRLQQQLACGLLQQSVKCGIGSAEHIIWNLEIINHLILALLPLVSATLTILF